MNAPTEEFVLGLHPSSRGFGWVLFDGPNTAFDWGIADIASHRNADALDRIVRILKKYRPKVLVLETFDDEKSKRAERIRKLGRSIADRAEKLGIAVHFYSRDQIRQTFDADQAVTREEIAAAVAKRIDVLAPRLPRPRKIWEAENPNIALFCAAASALTHYRTRQ
jgi:RNase H-fold protein (predicted Holliday junction resolvase)